MKKILLGFLLLCSFSAYAEETEIHELPPITGTWYGTDQSFSSLVSGVIQPPTMNGMTTYGTNWSMVANAQMKAAQEAGKKAEAAAKAAKKRVCVDEAKEKNSLDYDDLAERLSYQSGDCQREFANEPAAMETCITQANGHYEGKLQGLDDQLKLDEAWCEKQYGG